MIYLIVGTNAYRVEQEVARLTQEAGVVCEKPESTGMSPNALADMMRGGSLFAVKRLVLLRDISEQKHLWELIGEWASSMTDDTTLILVEAKPDRRTKAYKSIAKQATIVQATPWTDRDHALAEEWLRKLARTRGVGLSPTQVSDMVARAMIPADRGMVVDQFQLAHAIEALAVLDEVTDDAIATVLPAAIHDVLFDLITFAVNREEARVYEALADLRLNEDPYRVFPTLAAEWSRLVAVAVGDGPSDTIATELSIHPYVVSKLQRLAKHITRQQLHELTRLAVDIDAGMKLSQFAPWDGIDRFILGIALRR